MNVVGRCGRVVINKILSSQTLRVSRLGNVSRLLFDKDLIKMKERSVKLL